MTAARDELDGILTVCRRTAEKVYPDAGESVHADTCCGGAFAWAIGQIYVARADRDWDRADAVLDAAMEMIHEMAKGPLAEDGIAAFEEATHELVDETRTRPQPEVTDANALTDDELRELGLER
jgi:hypothetical protein